MYIVTKKEVDETDIQGIANAIVLDNALVYTTEFDRRIGKTTLVLKIADMFGIPVVTSFNPYKRMYEKEAVEKGLNVKVLFASETNSLRGVRVDGKSLEKVLVDETVSPNAMMELRKSFTVIGFVREGGQL